MASTDLPDEAVEGIAQFQSRADRLRAKGDDAAADAFEAMAKGYEAGYRAGMS